LVISPRRESEVKMWGFSQGKNGGEQRGRHRGQNTKTLCQQIPILNITTHTWGERESNAKIGVRRKKRNERRRVKGIAGKKRSLFF